MVVKKNKKSKNDLLIIKDETIIVNDEAVIIKDEAVIIKDETIIVKDDIPKKKIKKQPKVIATITPNGIEGSFMSEPRKPLIAHLQINTSEISFHDGPVFYDPKPPGQPEPYDSAIDNVFTNKNTEIEKSEIIVNNINKEITNQIPVPSTTNINLEKFSKISLMIEFRDTSVSRILPEKTEIACFWCSCQFNWQPCVLPEREEKGIYRVYGNFCSPSCAMSYILNESLDTHVRWERIALLHRIYSPLFKSGRIFPSPPRESLRLFGGPLSIDEFRNIISSSKVRIDIHIPPMVSIIGSIDTKPIDFYDSSMKYTISPLLGEALPKAEEGLRLKRSKPLKDINSTLDSCLNIKIKSR